VAFYSASAANPKTAPACQSKRAQEGIDVLHQGAEAAADIVVPVRHGPSAVLEAAIAILVPPGAWMTPSNDTNSDTIGFRISPLVSRFPSARGLRFVALRGAPDAIGSARCRMYAPNVAMASSSSSVMAAELISPRIRWKTLADTTTIMMPTAAQVTSHGVIRLSP
jgi:hypothetical protein